MGQSIDEVCNNCEGAILSAAEACENGGSGMAGIGPEHLEKACKAKDEIFRRRKVIYDMIKRHEMSFADLLAISDAGDRAVYKMRVSRAIKAFPGIGNQTTAWIMAETNIASSRRISGLGCCQRAKLVEIIDNELMAGKYVEPEHEYTPQVD